MEKYKFELSPNQITNLQNRGLKYPNGKLVFPKERKSYTEKFMKFWNMDKIEMTILILFIMALMMTSCSSTSHTYKGCDGTKKFKSQMYLR